VSHSIGYQPTVCDVSTKGVLKKKKIYGEAESMEVEGEQ